MIRGLDSASPPNLQQVIQAKAIGISVWSGYISSDPNNHFNLYRPWSKAEFDIARQCGNKPIAYCSGWDDPSKVSALADLWDVRLCLDVEAGIRGDGLWVQEWLDKSTAGLYGNMSVFRGRSAPFFILANYPGFDPQSTWPGVPPSLPHGWQWKGTHTEFGVGVDSTYLDDWFSTQSQGVFMALTDAEQQEILSDVRAINSEVVNKLHRGDTQIFDVVAATFDKVNAGGVTLPQNVQDAIVTIGNFIKEHYK